MDNIPQIDPAEIRIRQVPGAIKARLVIASRLKGQSEGDFIIELLDKSLPVYKAEEPTNAA
jgi:hypothetical protein